MFDSMGRPDMLTKRKHGTGPQPKWLVKTHKTPDPPDSASFFSSRVCKMSLADVLWGESALEPGFVI